MAQLVVWLPSQANTKGSVALEAQKGETFSHNQHVVIKEKGGAGEWSGKTKQNDIYKAGRIAVVKVKCDVAPTNPTKAIVDPPSPGDLIDVDVTVTSASDEESEVVITDEPT